MVGAQTTDLDIIMKILSMCEEPQRNMSITHTTNLCRAKVNDYLSLLKSLGLVDFHHSPKEYVITEKGSGFLHYWTELTRARKNIMTIAAIDY